MFLREWFEKTRDVLLNPHDFYDDLELREGKKYGFKFLAVSAAISGLTFGSVGLIGNIGSSPIVSSGSNFLIGSLIFGLFSIVVFTVDIAIVHALLDIKGTEEGLRATLQVLAYPSVLLALAWVPILNLLLGIYYLYVSVIGLKEVQNVSGAAAFLALVVSNALGWMVLLILFITFIAAIAGLIGAASMAGL